MINFKFKILNSYWLVVIRYWSRKPVKSLLIFFTTFFFVVLILKKGETDPLSIFVT
jgi:hypothetical protein